MALQFWKYQGSLDVADNGANTGTLLFEMDTAVVTDYAGALAAMAAVPALFEAVSGLEVVGYGVKTVYREEAIVYPAAGVELEDKASITLQLATFNKKANYKIGGPLIDIFVAPTGSSANVVNVANTDLVAWFDQWDATGPFTMSDGEKMQQILKGKRISAKSNNG